MASLKSNATLISTQCLECFEGRESLMGLTQSRQKMKIHRRALEVYLENMATQRG